MSEKIQEKIENRIIDFINLNSGGRLIVLKTKEAGSDINLFVKKKGDYESPKTETPENKNVVKARIFGVSKKKNINEVYLSVNGQAKTTDNNLFIKEINLENFDESKNIYFIFIFFNVLKQDIEENICILSLKQIKEKADLVKENIFKIESFLSKNKKDKYSEFLFNKKEVSRFFLNIISPV